MCGLCCGAFVCLQALFVDGHINFKSLQLVASYGVTYSIHFSPFPLNLWGHLKNVTSEPIEAQPCGDSEFYVRGRVICTVWPSLDPGAYGGGQYERGATICVGPDHEVVRQRSNVAAHCSSKMVANVMLDVFPLWRALQGDLEARLGGRLEGGQIVGFLE